MSSTFNRNDGISRRPRYTNYHYQQLHRGPTTPIDIDHTAHTVTPSFKNIQALEKRFISSASILHPSSIPEKYVEDQQQRRVHFSEHGNSSNDECNNIGTPSSVRRSQVVNYLLGKHTGEVCADEHTGDLSMPYGSNAMVYEDGGFRTCVYKNGSPVQVWNTTADDDTKHHHFLTSAHKKCHTHMKIPKSPQILKVVDPKYRFHQEHTQDTCARSTRIDTYLHHLDIGDAGSSQDMIHRTCYKASDYNSLHIHDFAFILRSNGSYTYAIIAGRSDDSILFVVDTSGSTKTLDSRHWPRCVRFVNSAAAAGSKKRLTKNKCTSGAEPTSSPASTLSSDFVGSLPVPPLARASTADGLNPLVRRKSSGTLRSSGVLSLFD